MIGDSRPATLKVIADKGMSPSADAVSLGLIVTELVINALKYAFPDPSKAAAVTVRYRSQRHGLEAFGFATMAWDARTRPGRGQGRTGHQPGQGAGASARRQGRDRKQADGHERVGQPRHLYIAGAPGGLTIRRDPQDGAGRRASFEGC